MSMLFWVVMPCRLVDRYQRFGETYCLHLQGRNVRIYLRVHTASQPRKTTSATSMKANFFLFVCCLHSFFSIWWWHDLHFSRLVTLFSFGNTIARHQGTVTSVLTEQKGFSVDRLFLISCTTRALSNGRWNLSNSHCLGNCNKSNG
jgi:hypothetical protein